MNSPTKYSVVVIGAGITGLLATLKLIRLGIPVLLLEANNVIARGPSTRNEGWIHAGSYHSFGIDDIETAVSVAKNCIYGYNQIINTYPECLEEPFTESIVLIKKPENVSKAEYRWQKAGVSFQRLSQKRLNELLSDVNIPRFAQGYLVKERAINTRILLERIFQEIKTISESRPSLVCIKKGVQDIRFAKDKKTFMLQFEDETTMVACGKMFLYTAGAGTKTIFEKEHPEINCPLRVFKSHLLVAKRLSKNNVFFVEEDEITAMGHREVTIVGSTKDNDEIKAEKNLEKADRMRGQKLVSKTQELFKQPLGDYQVYACQKVDVAEKDGYQSLEPKIYEDEALENHIICIPGKMTEAPLLVDKLVHLVFDRLDESSVAKRPCDLFKKNVTEQTL